jgi:hypothetical protein
LNSVSQQKTARFLRELDYHIQRNSREQAVVMKNTTGLTRAEIDCLCDMILDRIPQTQHGWPPILGLYRSLVIALTYLRRNHVQAKIAETYHVSQPTISWAIAWITPLLCAVLQEFIPTADDLSDKVQYLVDGTLLPCWSWDGHPELYSGKHHTTGLNVQVAATLDGRPAWISDAANGCRHDVACLDASGVLDGMDPANWMGDKGYVGRDMLTPIKKPAHRDLLDWEKELNHQINKIRATIERVIANFKTWRIIHTDCRRPLHTFTTTISTVIGLHFWATA